MIPTDKAVASQTKQAIKSRNDRLASEWAQHGLTQETATELLDLMKRYDLSPEKCTNHLNNTLQPNQMNDYARHMSKLILWKQLRAVRLKVCEKLISVLQDFYRPYPGRLERLLKVNASLTGLARSYYLNRASAELDKLEILFEMPNEHDKQPVGQVTFTYRNTAKMSSLAINWFSNPDIFLTNPDIHLVIEFPLRYARIDIGGIITDWETMSMARVMPGFWEWCWPLIKPVIENVEKIDFFSEITADQDELEVDIMPDAVNLDGYLTVLPS